MANKRLIDANALWLTFSEKVEKIEIGVKDKVDKTRSKIVLHWCMDKIATAPRVDAVEVVHGRWVMTLYTTTSKRGRVISNQKFACSVCGYGNGRKQSNYCPNCGAKMDGGNEE